MKKYRSTFAVEKMCKAFKVSRSGYYSWLNRKPSARQADRQSILQLIREIHKESNGRYGSPKITRELHKRGIQVSRPRVARLMKVAGIRSVVHRKFKIRTTDSKHNYPIAKNLLDRKFAPGAVARAWVSDITYIKTTQGCGAARAVISNRYCGLSRPQGSRMVVERNNENL